MGVPLWPMRGWHVQQLRKLAIARHAREEVMLHCDSDVIFVKPFDMNSLVCADGRVRLYRIDDGIRADIPQRGHAAWLAAAATLLGLPVSPQPTADYINNLITWRRSHVLALLDHVETVSGRDWVSAIGRHRSFSEALIYGQFVDRVLGEAAAMSPKACRCAGHGGSVTEPMRRASSTLSQASSRDRSRSASSPSSRRRLRCSSASSRRHPPRSNRRLEDIAAR